MNQQELRVIGLMSGTSLDGLDLAHVLLQVNHKHYTYQLLHTETIPYDAIWKARLANAPALPLNQLRVLDAEFGTWLGEQVLAFLLENDIHKVDLIASHGHTVFHQPEKRITLQIGNGPELCHVTNLPVVCDFRLQDVLLGGQGAPLVPIGDALLFSDYDACLNLGGFANISYQSGKDRIAFDICPVNIVLNELAKKLGKDFDENGTLARKGTLDNNVLAALNALPFYHQNPPKSLGREWVEQSLWPLLHGMKAEDGLRTVVEHAAEQIALATKHLSGKKMLVTGGGAFNALLMERISALNKMQIHIPEAKLITQKEALVFALLGALRWKGEANCLASVTGAPVNHSSGRIYMP